MTVHLCHTFIHDDAPSHRFKLVDSHLERMRIKVLDYTGSSPKLNPMENLWKLIKNRVSDKHHSSFQSLQYAIDIVWINEISSDFSKLLIGGMPKRFKAVFQNCGGQTKY